MPSAGHSSVPDRPHRVVQARVLAGVAGRRHPVGRQLHVAEARDGRRGDVGERLGHRHARRGGRVQQRQRRALAHRHRLAGVAVVAGGGDGGVGHRHLPGPHHLVARAPGPSTVRSPMVIRKVLSATVGRRSTRGDRLAQRRSRASSQRRPRRRARASPSRVIRGGLPSSTSSGMSIGRVARSGGRRRRACRRRWRCPARRTGSARARTAPRSAASALGVDRQHVALLGLVAPDLQRRHARLVAGDRAQLEARAAPARRAPARAARSTGRPRPRRGSRRWGCRRPAPSSGRSPPGSAAPSRRCRAAPRRNRGPRREAPDATDEAAPPPRPISMRRPAQHDDRRARRDLALLHVLGADVAEAARDHDRLVVAAHLGARRRRAPPARRCGSSRSALGRPNSLLKAAPPSGPSIMMSSARGDALGLAVVALPGRTAPGRRRFETREAVRPALGLAPRPVAPSSRISPPEPVAAPGKGEMAVGWLCVSTFIRMCTGSRVRAVHAAVAARGRSAPAVEPSITAALSL